MKLKQLLEQFRHEMVIGIEFDADHQLLRRRGLRISVRSLLMLRRLLH
jgi:hypothetical protein